MEANSLPHKITTTHVLENVDRYSSLGIPEWATEMFSKKWFHFVGFIFKVTFLAGNPEDKILRANWPRDRTQTSGCSPSFVWTAYLPCVPDTMSWDRSTLHHVSVTIENPHLPQTTQKFHLSILDSQHREMPRCLPITVTLLSIKTQSNSYPLTQKCHF